MFRPIGKFVVAHRWWVIAAWVVAAVLLVAFAPKFKASTEQTDFLPSKYESVQAFELAEKEFPEAQGATALIVATRQDGKPLTRGDEALAGQLATSLNAKRIKGIQGIQAGPVSQNRMVQMINVRFTSNDYGDKEITEALDELRDDIEAANKGNLKVLVTGEAAINADAQESYEKSDQVTFLATIIVIFVLLIFTFRSIVAALLPLVTVFLVMMVALSLIGTMNKVFDLKGDNMTQSMMPIVLFGIGTDYILFLLFRYRERLRRGEDKKQAMVESVHRVGEVIASAAFAVIIAFSALILASLGMLASMGPSISIAVFTTLVAALTLIPAIVSLLGPVVFWPSKSWKSEPKHSMAARLGRLVSAKPLAVALVSGIILVVLAFGAIGYKANFDMASAPPDTEAAKGLTQLEKGFPPGATQLTQVYVTSDNDGPLPAGAADTVAAGLNGVKGVGSVAKPQTSKNDRAALIEVTLSNDPLSEQAMKDVKGPIRDAAHKAAPPGTEANTGGTTAVMVDLQSAMNRDYAVVFPIAGVLIAIILGLLLRSIVAPIYLMVAVALTFLATIGSSVYIFQTVKGNNGVVFFLPIVVYLFVTALGTDYNILTIARLREEAREGRKPREGLAHAFEQTAPTVASAGLILAGSFGTFLLANTDAMQQMGTSVAIGVILAAFVMSLFLVPAITALLGHAAWWPGHQDAPDPEAHAEAELVTAATGAGDDQRSQAP